ncbi:alpha/beta fold hydrolase [Noviherbaspirillum denitrificans]|nr:alpha/beta hydrolase [Noviherbaspirillum denitrificans]
MPEHVELQVEGRGVRLEYARILAADDGAPLIVFLHEGLGSLSMWGDWPQRLCRATNTRGLVFSRYGYGHSTPRPTGNWPSDYLELEARVMLPALFAALDIQPEKEKVILFGHSDGGTIALLHSAMFPHTLAATIVLAPHEFVEEVGTQRIKTLQQGFNGSSLARMLKEHHADPTGVFRGWSELWVADRYRDWNIEHWLSRITCPLMVAQGAQDQYGTLEQVHAVTRAVPHAESVILENCRHIPHQEQPEALLNHVRRFLSLHELVDLLAASDS